MKARVLTTILNDTNVMPISCIFNGERRAIKNQSKNFYYFCTGRWKWDYAEKHLCSDFRY